MTKDNKNINESTNLLCEQYDPFNLIENRLKQIPIEFCDNDRERESHFCYINSDIDFHFTEGLICKMSNVVIDPSKWKSSGLNYEKGPIDNITKGFPLISKGFFNMICNQKKDLNISYNQQLYGHYINSWNYNFDKKENYEELAPNKTIFFVSRNQDSPSLFFGGAEIINALALISHFHLTPENIQVVFLESMYLNKDPNYIFYKHLISKGGEPIHIKNLSKKYHISNAFHIPIGWDTPLTYRIKEIPTCKNQSKAYSYLNQFVNKYINIPEFKDSLNYDNETFYYPKSIKDLNSKNYSKFLTFQWRRQFPKGRKFQKRLLGNGPEIVEKLMEKLPKNILIRLIDTAKLSLIQQISIMRKTDYFLGIHGAGLFLSVFMPKASIFHEIYANKRTRNLARAANLSGHMSYLNKFDAKIVIIDDCEYQFYDPELVVSSVLEHMNASKFF